MSRSQISGLLLLGGLAALLSVTMPQAALARCGGKAAEQPTPAARMQARFPQPAKVSHLVGLPMLDCGDSTIGFVRDVVRTPDGAIKLIVPFAAWFGWVPVQAADRFRRPVAVPIEDVAILASQINALDMNPDDFAKAPTWSAATGTSLSPDETVKIGLQRR